jgi:hypothetical protein
VRSAWAVRGRVRRGVVAELSRQGYKPQLVGKQLGLLAALSGWLAAEGVAVSGLSR